jgi:hypothetical protein
LTASTNFGRRQPPAAAPTAPAASRRTPAPAEAPAPSSLDLDPRAEAFRAELAASRREDAQTFSQWRASQAYRTWIFWALTLLSFAPGIVTLVLDGPIELAGALEIAAMVGNVWIRRERFRRRREIVAWEDPSDREIS